MLTRFTDAYIRHQGEMSLTKHNKRTHVFQDFKYMRISFHIDANILLFPTKESALDGWSDTAGVDDG